MSDGYEGIYTPYNTKEFEAMVTDARSHLNGCGTRLQSVGVDLRRMLPHAKNVQSRRGMAGLDLTLAAWQVARQFAQADAAMRSGSAALARAHQIYYGTFHAPNHHNVGERGAFDAG